MKDLWFYETKIGTMGIAGDDQGVTDVFLGERASAQGMRLAETPLLCQAAREIREYLDGERRGFQTEIHLEGTPFQKKVWEALCQIPYGETRSYKEIAQSIGEPRACRAVGMANNKNPVMILVPCHRVVGSDGSLTGYAGGLDVKRALLEIEDPSRSWGEDVRKADSQKDGAQRNGIQGTDIQADVIRAALEEMAEPAFQRFSSSLIPNIPAESVLGVRLPKLRKRAAKIAKGDWRAYLAQARDDSYEEIMLQGMVIGKIQAPLWEILGHVRAFLPKIDNWSTCDSFCAGLKLPKIYPAEMWDFIQPYFKSQKEYEIRFAVVMLLDYYVEETYKNSAFRILDGIRHDTYYVKMAVAWAISIFYIRFPEDTLAFLRECSLDDATYNKALQKIIESRAVDAGVKEGIRRMKRRSGGLVQGSFTFFM